MSEVTYEQVEKAIKFFDENGMTAAELKEKMLDDVEYCRKQGYWISFLEGKPAPGETVLALSYDCRPKGGELIAIMDDWSTARSHLGLSHWRALKPPALPHPEAHHPQG